MKKGTKLKTTHQITSSDLRRVAQLIRRYASEYDIAADELDEAAISTIPAKGFTALENNALKLIRGHAKTIRSPVQSKIDEKELRDILRAEQEEAEAQDDVAALVTQEKTRKSRKKGAE